METDPEGGKVAPLEPWDDALGRNCSGAGLIPSRSYRSCIELDREDAALAHERLVLTPPSDPDPNWLDPPFGFAASAVPVTTTNNIDAMTAARKNLFVTPDHLSSSGQTLPSGQFPAV